MQTINGLYVTHIEMMEVVDRESVRLCVTYTSADGRQHKDYGRYNVIINAYNPGLDSDHADYSNLQKVIETR